LARVRFEVIAHMTIVWMRLALKTSFWTTT
jgi:hypothetical protein